MIDQDLENKIAQIKAFIELWENFYQSYKQAITQPSFTEEDEKNFLELKSSLARKYQGLMDSLGLKPTAEDRTFDVISQVMSLKNITTLSPLQMQKLENDWHNSYITLNKIMGSLENRRDELAKISVVKESLKKFFTNPFFALILIITIIYFLYYVVTTVIK
ncbi:MAG: hypothetical protein GY853_07695 [PVC group bacterium]|nr:hypothetical protein [PVC group bacterium]